MNNGQMDRGNENPTQHLPWWLRKTTKKNLSQVGRLRDLNPGPPECESRALPRSHLARYDQYCFCCYVIKSAGGAAKKALLSRRLKSTAYRNKSLTN